MSVPWGILYIGIHFQQNISNFKWFSSITSYNMGPNFNLNYLSSMFMDIERFETTTTIEEKLLRKPVPDEDIWRLPLLCKFLMQRQDMEVMMENTEGITDLIDSLCSSWSKWSNWYWPLTTVVGLSKALFIAVCVRWLTYLAEAWHSCGLSWEVDLSGWIPRQSLINQFCIWDPPTLLWLFLFYFYELCKYVRNTTNIYQVNVNFTSLRFPAKQPVIKLAIQMVFCPAKKRI